MLPQLPSAVTQLGVSVQKKSSSIMMLAAIFAQGERYSSDYIANYANVYVLDALKRVPGAGQAQVMGVADQAMRIWMNPDRMASLGITRWMFSMREAAAGFGSGMPLVWHARSPAASARRAGQRAGRSKVKLLPTPTVLSQAIRPPCASTISREM